MQYFKTSCGGKLNLAKNWFHSRIERLLYQKLLPSRKVQFQTYTLDTAAIKIEKNENSTNCMTRQRKSPQQASRTFKYVILFATSDNLKKINNTYRNQKLIALIFDINICHYKS